MPSNFVLDNLSASTCHIVTIIWSSYTSKYDYSFLNNDFFNFNFNFFEEKLFFFFLQEFPFEILKEINFSSCKSIQKLPELWTPNLEKLDLPYCENLVEIHEFVGLLDKLKTWNLSNCHRLQTLPRRLKLNSLTHFDFRDCLRLKKFPNIHLEMKCLKSLILLQCGIEELPSSIGYLTQIQRLNLMDCCNLREVPGSIYKLQKLESFGLANNIFKPTSNSFDDSFGYGFVNLKSLNLISNNIIELDFMECQYFSALERLHVSVKNIVTIPKSFSRLTRLR